MKASQSPQQSQHSLFPSTTEVILSALGAVSLILIANWAKGNF
jgi:hypothetical protein